MTDLAEPDVPSTDADEMIQQCSHVTDARKGVCVIYDSNSDDRDGGVPWVQSTVHLSLEVVR